ncbi:MAG: bifunctional NADH-specific enoyl-ACP reductase/trans-2-enoyl-CoA reductase, partial [Treponema sp.]|nr:bifunctional NADH-specific enoyl-ACP reductase/trans-2-enoyl-CoA reductase [Treponema sp.]
VDSEGRIRIDDWELDPAVQAEVDKIMANVKEENVAELTDLEGLRHDFLNINGFDVEGVDYEKDVADMTKID